MPGITDSVGEGSSVNKTHDVALVQAMLRVIKKNGVAYLGGLYDGAYGPQTKGAILKFQMDYNLVGGKSIDKKGTMAPAGETLKKLNAMLPAPYKTMHIIANTKTVYLEGSSKDAAASKAAITGYQNFEATFRNKVGQLVQAMYDQHKIVLKVTRSGWRRNFKEQAVLHKKGTGASPGQSNHNFGRAVDIGFKGLQWLKGDGTIVTDADWLNSLEALNAAKANAFWDARDAIAFKGPISLFRLNKERIHLQNYNDATVDSKRSLAALLNLVGTMKWQSGYKCNLGGGKQLFHVGSASQIWSGKATVSKAEYAKSKGIPVAKVTAKDIANIQKALKGDFELADRNWKKWKPIP